MKKIILVFAFALGIVSLSSAQVNGKAIGLRLGGTYGDGAEISYQQALGQANRLEVDLGTGHYLGFALTGVYQWVWDLSQLADGFNWYAGVGGTLGLGSSNNSGFGLGVDGQVGLEYNFNIPLQLSIDYRPTIYFLPGFDGGYDGISLGVRYKF